MPATYTIPPKYQNRRTSKEIAEHLVENHYFAGNPEVVDIVINSIRYPTIIEHLSEDVQKLNPSDLDTKQEIDIPTFDEFKDYYCIPIAQNEDEKVEIESNMPKGWTLTKEGELLQGTTGYLIDENGLYILKDGRRVKEEIADENLRIGNKISVDGLADLLGITITDASSILSNCLLTKDLLTDHFRTIPEVVYQAFQINIGYEFLKSNRTVLAVLTNDSPYWISCGKEAMNNAVFGVLGADETGIPIIVTRIGSPRNENKLVIAGPHGDERNAQRVSMTAQRYFIRNEMVSTGDKTPVLYFIPCLSPTMAFADARGIPKQFFDNGFTRRNGTQIWGKRERYHLGGSEALTIPALHDAMTYPNRQRIQDQENAAEPQYGIDGNRDYYYSLPSSQIFVKFISNLAGIALGYGTRIYDDDPNTDLMKNLTVIMMHGYDWKWDGGYPNNGTVYGSYYKLRETQDRRQGWQMVAQDSIISKYTHFIMNNLVGYKFRRPFDRFYGMTNNEDGNYKPEKYKGEWCRSLYSEDDVEVGNATRGIPVFDIELPMNRPSQYDEGTRGDSRRPYDPLTVGTDSAQRPFFSYPNNNSDLEDKDRNGKLVNSALYTFYQLLERYYSERENTEYEWKI